MNVIYCKELNRYFEDIKTAAICTNFTTNYIKCCITGKYKNPFYYHFYSVPLNNKMVLTTFDSVRNTCNVNKEIEKINNRFKVYYKNESESKIDLSVDKPKGKKTKVIYCAETNRFYKSYKEAAESTKMTVGYIKLVCEKKIKIPYALHFEYRYI